jgi:hypothetical protein
MLKSEPLKARLGRDIAVAGSILAVAGLAIGAAATSETTAPEAITDAKSEVVKVVPALGKEQTKSDVPPASVSLDLHGPTGIDPTSVRLLGSDDRATYWVALDHNGSTCLIALLSDDTSGGSCNTIGLIKANGLGLAVSGNPFEGVKGVEAHLLPMGADLTTVSKPWATLGENLVTLPLEATARSIDVNVDGGAVKIVELGTPQ